jgi:hypothetical protein
MSKEWHYISQDEIVAIGFIQFASFIHVFKDNGSVVVVQRKDINEDSFEENNLNGIEILGRCVEILENIEGIDEQEIYIKLEEPRDNVKQGIFDSMYTHFGVTGALNTRESFNAIHLFNKTRSLSTFIFLNKRNEGKDLYNTIANLINHVNDHPTDAVFLSDNVYIRAMKDYVSIKHNDLHIQSND